MMQLIRTTGWSPANSNAGGMTAGPAVARLEEQIRNLQNEQPRALHDDERATLLALADDLPALWNHPAASNEIRKRILRTVLEEIVVTAEAIGCASCCIGGAEITRGLK